MLQQSHIRLQPFEAGGKDHSFCCCQYGTYPFAKVFTLNIRCGINKVRWEYDKNRISGTVREQEYFN